MMCSEAIWLCLLPLVYYPRSAEAAGDVILGASLVRLREDRRRVRIFDELAEIHEGGVVGAARRLLHVVGDDGDAVVGFELVDQLLDLLRRDRVQRRAGLVEQDHLRLYRDGAGDAEPLLLAAGEAETALFQLVLDL